jgi:hypothetical protein
VNVAVVRMPGELVLAAVHDDDLVAACRQRRRYPCPDEPGSAENYHSHPGITASDD